MPRRKFRPAKKTEKVAGYQVALTLDEQTQDARDAQLRAIDANPKIKAFTKRKGKVKQAHRKHTQKDVVTFTVDTEDEAKELVAALQEQYPGKTIHSSALGVQIPPDPIEIDDESGSIKESDPGAAHGRVLGNANEQFATQPNLIVHTMSGNQPTWMEQILGKDASSEIIFAEFDTGVRADHNSVFKSTPNVLTLFDCIGGECIRTDVPRNANQVARKQYSDDGNSHGTHVVADALRFVPNAEVLSFKVIDDDGNGPFHAIEAAFDELYKELKRRKDAGDDRKVVLNASLSWLADLAPRGFNDRIQQKINKLNNDFGDRLCIVVAAGNYGLDLTKEKIYPASFNGVVTIGALNSDLLLAGFSDRGPNVLGAVGVDVVSASNSGAIDAEKSKSGTSMSSPSVAGMMANLWQLMPGLNANELKKLIKDLSIDPNSARYINFLAGGDDPDTNMYAQTLPIVNLEINRVLKYIIDNRLQSKCAPGVFNKMQALAPTYQVTGIPITGTKQHFLMRNKALKRFNSGDTVSYQITVGPCRTPQSLTIAAASQEMVGSDGIQDMVALASENGMRVVPGQMLMAPITMNLPVSTSAQSYTFTITRNPDTLLGREAAVIRVFDAQGRDVTTNVLPLMSRQPPLLGGVSTDFKKCAIADLKLQITRSSGVQVLGFNSDVIAPAPAPTVATHAPTRGTTAPTTGRPSLPPTARPTTKKPTPVPTPVPTNPVTLPPTAATPQPTIATPNPTSGTSAPSVVNEYEYEDPITGMPTPAPVTFSPTAPATAPTRRPSKPAGGKGKKPTRRPTRRGTATGAPTGVTATPTTQEYEPLTETPTTATPSAMPTTAMPTTAPTPDLFAEPIGLTYGNCGLLTMTQRLRDQYKINQNLMFKISNYLFMISPNGGNKFNIKCMTLSGATVAAQDFTLDGINQLEAIKISNNNNQLTIGIFKQWEAKAVPLLTLPNENTNDFNVKLPKAYGATQISVKSCQERIDRGLQESIHGVDPDATTTEAGFTPIEQLRRDRLPGHGSGELPGSAMHQGEFTPQTPRPDFLGLFALGATLFGAYMERRRIRELLARGRTTIASSAKATSGSELDPEQPMLVIGTEKAIDRIAKELAEIYRPEPTGPKTP